MEGKTAGSFNVLDMTTTISCTDAGIKKPPKWR